MLAAFNGNNYLQWNGCEAKTERKRFIIRFYVMGSACVTWLMLHTLNICSSAPIEYHYRLQNIINKSTNNKWTKKRRLQNSFFIDISH